MGVDMTPEMLAKARKNTESYRQTNRARYRSSSGWEKSNICRWPTTVWTRSFPTA